MSNALVKVSNGLLEPELWHVLETHMCVPETYMCVPETHMCVLETYMCVPETYVCPRNICVCIPETYMCVPEHICVPETFMRPRNSGSFSHHSGSLCVRILTLTFFGNPPLDWKGFITFPGVVAPLPPPSGKIS